MSLKEHYPLFAELFIDLKTNLIADELAKLVENVICTENISVDTELSDSFKHNHNYKF